MEKAKAFNAGKKDISKSHVKFYITDHEDNNFENDKDMANFVNDFFINIGLDLANAINLDNSDCLNRLPISLDSGSLLEEFPPITNEELLKL